MADKKSPILILEDVRKRYRPDDPDVLTVNNLVMERGAQICLTGASGSGKTTLLHVISGILRQDTGRVVVDGTDLTPLTGAQVDEFRARRIGLMFQRHHLLPGFSALDNVLIAISLGRREGGAPARMRSLALLDRVGLREKAGRRPGQLSLGERQRIGLARALANGPPLVLADEPTASLDPANAHKALVLMTSLCAETGASLLVVAHEPETVRFFDRVVRLEDLAS